MTWAQQHPFTIKGKIGKVDYPATIYLYRPEAEVKLDSVVMKNGRFEFRGIAAHGEFGTLMLNHHGSGHRRLPDYFGIYLHQGVIGISSNDSLMHATTTGSALNADNKRLEDKLTPSRRRLDALFAKMEQTPAEERRTPEWTAMHREARQEVAAEEQRILLDYIRQNPNSLIGLFALQRFAGSKPDLQQIEPLFASLSAEVRESKRGRDYAERLANIKATSAGNIAPAFTLNDPDGTPVSLADYRGRYVLLDFWASWCVPCREEHPNLVKAYQTYKDHNFTILSVSVDRKDDRSAWLKAVEDDGLVWTNVWEQNPWDDEGTQRIYDVQSIPQNFLIDPDGKIVAKNLRGTALASKLAELLK